MITGTHTIIYTNEPEALKAWFRDVLEFPFVDVGDGWLIFSLPRRRSQSILLKDRQNTSCT